MSTNKDKDRDYQAYIRENAPNPDKRSGIEQREERRKLVALKTKITIRLDSEILDEFKRLAPEGKGYQNLINQALREWLSAQGVKELLREELTGIMAEAVESFKDSRQSIGG